jgi:hypothetical protein
MALDGIRFREVYLKVRGQAPGWLGWLGCLGWLGWLGCRAAGLPGCRAA